MAATDLQKSGPFVTNGPRAIVGEGSPYHNEYVIPTDPRFHSRAMSLYAQLGKELGVANQFPAYSIGGIIPDIPNPIEGIKDVAGAIRKGAVMAAFAPINAAADALINEIPIKFLKDTLRELKNDVYDWAQGKDDGIPEAYRGALIRGSRTGTRILAGEKNQDEAIVPLPGGIGDLGKREYHFHDATFEFPNITDGDDAEKFMKNLETLVGDD